jgi:hypothetical protein
MCNLGIFKNAMKKPTVIHKNRPFNFIKRLVFAGGLNFDFPVWVPVWVPMNEILRFHNFGWVYCLQYIKRDLCMTISEAGTAWSLKLLEKVLLCRNLGTAPILVCTTYDTITEMQLKGLKNAHYRANSEEVWILYVYRSCRIPGGFCHRQTLSS